MRDSFQITYSLGKRKEPLEFSESEYADITALILTLEHFLTVYEGTFTLSFSDLNLDFDFKPDLSTIFEEIPSVLNRLKTDSKMESPIELYFYEEGTDLGFLLTRRGDMINMQFLKGPMTGKRFLKLPQVKLTISAISFFREWSRFLNMVLRHLIEFNPSLENEASYQEYSSALVDYDLE